MVMKAKPKFAIIAKLEGKDPSATPCGPIRGGEGVFNFHTFRFLSQPLPCLKLRCPEPLPEPLPLPPP